VPCGRETGRLLAAIRQQKDIRQSEILKTGKYGHAGENAMNFQDGRNEAENRRHKISARELISMLKADPNICLMSYLELHGIDYRPIDRLLENAGLSIKQIDDVWETKIADIDIIMWIQLTNGRSKPVPAGLEQT
jgi:hypothetical protein